MYMCTCIHTRINAYICTHTYVQGDRRHEPGSLLHTGPVILKKASADRQTDSESLNAGAALPERLQKLLDEVMSVHVEACERLKTPLVQIIN